MFKALSRQNGQSQDWVIRVERTGNALRLRSNVGR